MERHHHHHHHHQQQQQSKQAEDGNDEAFRALLGAVNEGKIQDIDWLKRKFREVLLKEENHNHYEAAAFNGLRRREEQHQEMLLETVGDDDEELEEQGDAPPSYQSAEMVEGPWMMRSRRGQGVEQEEDEHGRHHKEAAIMTTPHGFVPAIDGLVPVPANTPASDRQQDRYHHPSPSPPSWSTTSYR